MRVCVCMCVCVCVGDVMLEEAGGLGNFTVLNVMVDYRFIKNEFFPS